MYMHIHVTRFSISLGSVSLLFLYETLRFAVRTLTLPLDTRPTFAGESYCRVRYCMLTTAVRENAAAPAVNAARWQLAEAAAAAAAGAAAEGAAAAISHEKNRICST